MSKKTEPRKITVNGFPAWQFPDGRTVPVVQGGSGPSWTQTQEPPQEPGEEGQPPPQSQEPPAPQNPPDDSLRIPEDPPQEPEGGNPQQPDQFFTKEDIERARQQEKDKLYGRLSKQEEQLQTLMEREAERERQEEEERQRREEEARRAEEEELDVRSLLQKKEQEWEQRFTEIQQQAEAERQVFEKEREFQALKDYAAQRLQEEQDEIMPELRDLVKGNTPEEVEESIALVKDRTARILQQVTAQQQAQQPPQQPQVPRGAPVTAPPAGPMENEMGHRTMTAEDIRNMDMDTYAEQREKILSAMRQRNNDRGIYG